MRKLVKLSAVAAFLFAGVFMLSVSGTQAAASAVPEEASPRSLYVSNCARCHGINGKAQTALGRKLEADDLTTSNAGVAKIIRMITNGRDDMPSFRRKLTTAQIASVAGYAKSLQ